MEWNTKVINEEHTVHTITHKGKRCYWNEYKKADSYLSDPNIGHVELIETKEDAKRYMVYMED